MASATVLLGRPIRCKSCRAEILFVRTDAGKVMPLDAVPVAGEAWVIEGDTCRRAGPDDDHAQRYRAHWASCTNPDAHRRARGKK